MRIACSILILGLFLPLSGRAGEKQFLSEYLSLPPALEKLYGDPQIKVGSEHRKGPPRIAIRGEGAYLPKQGILPPRAGTRLSVRGAEDAGSGEMRAMLARFLLGDFYAKVIAAEARSWQERRLELSELIPFNRERFVDLGTRRLFGKSSGEEWFDAWWTIRMGLPQQTDQSHHLVIIHLMYDYDAAKNVFGHFCFGLRKRGGDAQNDLIFDFRAPWHLDRQPKITEGLNIHNRLLLNGITENLYDWLYTQTLYRQCDVHMWFLPVSREQVAMLRSYEEKGGQHEAGLFRGLRKNCASLGMAFLDRLKPISNPVSLGKGIADFPLKAVEDSLDGREDELPFYRLGNNTRESGQKATAKSKIHRAQPGRSSSRSFRLLRQVPGIN